MKRGLRLILILGLIVAGWFGTGLARSMFSLDQLIVSVDEPDKILSMTARVCGREARLMRFGDNFSAIFRVRCEEAGAFVVRFRDGREMTCSIGYVTPGLGFTHRRQISDTGCEPDRASNNAAA